MRTTIPQLALLVALLWNTGCQHAHDHADQADGSEAETAQITIWTDRHEVFAEHLVPVAGDPTTFITHVTDLQTLEPRREGPVVFVISKDGTALRHKEPEPARAGIYLPKLVFPSPGAWELALRVPVEGGEANIDLGTIQVAPDEPTARATEVPESPAGISFLKEQQWTILSRTEPITTRPLVEHLRVPARIRAKPGTSSTITAPVSGRLVSPGRGDAVLPGQSVRAGLVLALLEPVFSEAGVQVAESRAEAIRAEAALSLAQAHYDRTRDLAAQKVKSQRELQEAEAALISARARHSATSSMLETFQDSRNESEPKQGVRMELRAPFDGILNSVSAGPGDLVPAGEAIFSVVDSRVVWVEAGIPESSIARLGQAREAYAEGNGVSPWQAPITGEGQGRFLSLGLEVDAISRTVPLLYETRNTEGRFRIGQDITLRVETSRAENAVAVPESALVEEGDLIVAYVQLSGETFEKRVIQAGISDKGFVQVLDGLQEGERVVSKGAVALRLASISGVIPAHGHAH